MKQDYHNTHLGDISINNDVIKNIAFKAAIEVGGICATDMGYFGKIVNKLTRKGAAAHDVKLEFPSETEVKIILRLTIGYGINIPEAASTVQENVKSAVEHMTGLTVNEVIVKITGMRDQKEAEK